MNDGEPRRQTAFLGSGVEGIMCDLRWKKTALALLLFPSL